MWKLHFWSKSFAVIRSNEGQHPYYCIYENALKRKKRWSALLTVAIDRSSVLQCNWKLNWIRAKPRQTCTRKKWWQKGDQLGKKIYCQHFSDHHPGWLVCLSVCRSVHWAWWRRRKNVSTSKGKNEYFSLLAINNLLDKIFQRSKFFFSSFTFLEFGNEDDFEGGIRVFGLFLPFFTLSHSITTPWNSSLILLTTKCKNALFGFEQKIVLLVDFKRSAQLTPLNVYFVSCSLSNNCMWTESNSWWWYLYCLLPL